MNEMDDFAGTARLFPLPNLVMFPNVVQPLHIFEPRYRQMTADALDNDRLLGMALLQPGTESEDDSQPAVFPVICMGKIVKEHYLEDGRYNLLLRGLQRARIMEELDQSREYRTARVELLDESFHQGETPALRKDIGLAVRPWFPKDSPAVAELEKLLQSNMPLGAVCDILAFAIPLATDAKQSLLTELDVVQRGLQLLQFLAGDTPGRLRFPIDFSNN